MKTIRQRLSWLARQFGVHADHLWQQPSYRMMGLVDRPIDLIVDVGANTGQFAREARSHFPDAHIVSFEPQPRVFEELANWARIDGNATALNIAVGDAEAVLPMHVHLEHSPSSSLLSSTNHNHEMFPQTVSEAIIEVQVRRIDDVLTEIGRVAGPGTFLKFDVQGFEEKAMRGAAASLAACQAAVTEVCLDPLYGGQADFPALLDIARGAGLRYSGNLHQALARDGHVIYFDAMFMRNQAGQPDAR